jgi:hypothetical protein
MDETNEVIDVVRQLALYLRRNPRACDTALGIARWWLAGSAHTQPALVDMALSRMVDLGVLECLPAADGRRRYRRTEPAALTDARLDQLATASGTLH